MKEVWHPVVGYEGLYEVSDQGRVRSTETKVRTKGGGLRNRPSKVLSPFVFTGYWKVNLYKRGFKTTYRVHQLVAEAFIGPKPEGLVIRHGPLGKFVNTPANLSYGSYQDNSNDMVESGKSLKGTKNAQSRLTAEDVLFIYNHPAEHGAGSFLARKFGVSNTLISNIRKGRAWSWLTGAE